VVEIRGRDALQVLFEKFKDSVDGGAAPVLENLKPFKTYRWMLSDVQRVQYLEWVQQSSAVQGAKAAICGPSTANPGEGASSSASSTAIVAATPAVLSSRCAADELEGTKPAASTAYEKKKAAASDEKKAEMMQWFFAEGQTRQEVSCTLGQHAACALGQHASTCFACTLGQRRLLVVFIN